MDVLQLQYPHLSVKLLVAAPVGPRVAECLGAISVGKDWALLRPYSWRALLAGGRVFGDVWRCFSVCRVDLMALQGRLYFTEWGPVSR
jgi:hypothetical protein